MPDRKLYLLSYHHHAGDLFQRYVEATDMAEAVVLAAELVRSLAHPVIELKVLRVSVRPPLRKGGTGG